MEIFNQQTFCWHALHCHSTVRWIIIEVTVQMSWLNTIHMNFGWLVCGSVCGLCIRYSIQLISFAFYYLRNFQFHGYYITVMINSNEMRKMHRNFHTLQTGSYGKLSAWASLSCHFNWTTLFIKQIFIFLEDCHM